MLPLAKVNLIRIEQIIKVGEGKKINRFIFHGELQFDNYELRKLKEFYEYLVAQNQESELSGIEDEDRLKFLQATDYNFKATLQAIQNHQ